MVAAFAVSLFIGLCITSMLACERACLRACLLVYIPNKANSHQKQRHSPAISPANIRQTHRLLLMLLQHICKPVY